MSHKRERRIAGVGGNTWTLSAATTAHSVRIKRNDLPRGQEGGPARGEVVSRACLQAAPAQRVVRDLYLPFPPVPRDSVCVVQNTE